MSFDPTDSKRDLESSEEAAKGNVATLWADGDPTESDSPPPWLNRRNAATQPQLEETSLVVGTDAGLTPPVVGVLQVVFTLNGRPVSSKIEARTTLLELLQDTFRLSGAQKGCDQGRCGACTVLVDGRRVLSCLTLAASLEKKEVVTIEGLAQTGKLQPLQAAFIAHGAYQCEVCTPGRLMSAAGLLDEPWPLSPEGVRQGMSGHHCQCGSYCGTVAAIAEVRSGTGPAVA